MNNLNVPITRVIKQHVSLMENSMNFLSDYEKT